MITELAQLITILETLEDEGSIEVHQQVEMTDTTGNPLLDGDGERVIQDVIIIGDGRCYVERDDNDPFAVQAFIDALDALGDWLPDIIEILRKENDHDR